MDANEQAAAAVRDVDGADGRHADRGGADQNGADQNGADQGTVDNDDAHDDSAGGHGAGEQAGIGRDLTGVALTTGRLVLAAPTAADVDAITEICQDPDIQAWNRVPSPYARADAEHFVQQVVGAGAAAGTAAVFGMYDAVTARLLGGVGLYGITGPNAPNGAMAEIVYWTAPEARGRGLTTEAVRAVSRWALADLRLDRLQWSAFAGNEASRRIAEKAGYTFEGTLRSRVVRRGGRCDLWVASLLPGEA